MPRKHPNLQFGNPYDGTLDLELYTIAKSLNPSKRRKLAVVYAIWIRMLLKDGSTGVEGGGFDHVGFIRTYHPDLYALTGDCTPTELRGWAVKLTQWITQLIMSADRLEKPPRKGIPPTDLVDFLPRYVVASAN